MSAITPAEVEAVFAALGSALAGEPEPAWGRNARAHMQSAQQKLAAMSGTASLVPLTDGEARAAAGALGQQTNGNARCFQEWRLSTHGSYAQWLALLRAEAQIEDAIR